MKNYVTGKFSDVLREGAEKSEAEYALLNIGKAYVKFFADNPHYFSFIYDNDDYRIELTEDTFEGDFEPFIIFTDIALKCMECHQIEKESYHDNLVIMWAAVHGLAAMANMKGFCYEGDWEALTEKLLISKINM